MLLTVLAELIAIDEQLDPVLRAESIFSVVGAIFEEEAQWHIVAFLDVKVS